MTTDQPETLSVPKAQFIRHVVALAREGPIEWHCNDDVQEDLDYTDVFRPSNLLHAENHEECYVLFFETTGSVSERVARATHWQPAEYETHEVPIHGEVTMAWPDDEYQLPETTARIEQVDYPTEPPAPDVHAHKYDL